MRDEELLSLVVRRHEQALGQLYDRYGRLVYTVALRITGDREMAEEVVQDVFQNVWQTAAELPPGQQPQAGEIVASTNEPDGGSPSPTSDPLIAGPANA